MISLKNLWLNAKKRMFNSVKKINTIYNVENNYLLMEDGLGFHAFRHAIIEVFTAANPSDPQNKTEELLKRANEPFLEAPLPFNGCKKIVSLLFFALKGQNGFEFLHNIIKLFTELPLRLIDYTAQTGYLLSLKKAKKLMNHPNRHPLSFVIISFLFLTTFVCFSIHTAVKAASLITRACISPDKSFHRMAAIDPALGYLSLAVSVIGQAIIGSFTFGAAWAVMPAITHPMLFIFKAISASPIGVVSHSIAHSVTHGITSRTDSTAGFLIGSIIGFIKNAFVFYKNKILPSEESTLSPTLKQSLLKQSLLKQSLQENQDNSDNNGVQIQEINEINSIRSSYSHILGSVFHAVRSKNIERTYTDRIDKLINSDKTAFKIYQHLKTFGLFTINAWPDKLKHQLMDTIELLPDQDYVTIQDLKDFMAYFIDKSNPDNFEKVFEFIESAITNEKSFTDIPIQLAAERLEDEPSISGYNKYPSFSSTISYESNCI